MQVPSFMLSCIQIDASNKMPLRACVSGLMLKIALSGKDHGQAKPVA